MGGCADTDARVGDLETDNRFGVSFGFFLGAQDYFAVLSEFDRVAHQIGDHLAEAAGVATQRRRHVAVNQRRQFDLLLMRPPGE